MIEVRAAGSRGANCFRFLYVNTEADVAMVVGSGRSKPRGKCRRNPTLTT